MKFQKSKTKKRKKKKRVKDEIDRLGNVQRNQITQHLLIKKKRSFGRNPKPFHTDLILITHTPLRKSGRISCTENG